VTETDTRYRDTTHFHFDSWQTVLDRIELDVIRAERALELDGDLTPVEEWHVPVTYGPLPPELRDRAEEILGRQRRVLSRLSEQLTATTRHRAIVDDVAQLSSRTSELAVYVDVSA
jgi:hypothetical protein